MALKHILGDLPVIRMLDFFVEHNTGDHTRAEIAKYTDSGPTAMKKDFPLLVRCGIIIETRRIAGVPLYAIDLENDMTQSMIKFDDDLTGYCTNMLLEESGEKNAETLGEDEYDEARTSIEDSRPVNH